MNPTRLMTVLVLALIASACGGGGDGATNPAARCQYDSSLAWNDAKCVSPVDTRPVVLSLFFGRKDVNGVWHPLTDNVPYTMRYSHLPCTNLNGGGDIGVPLAAVLVTKDSASMSPAIFDLESSDTTVIAFAHIRTPQLSVTFKRPGTTTITARYRDGMALSKSVILGDAFYAGPGDCYANSR